MATGKWIKITILAIFASGLVAYFALDGAKWLNLNSLQQHRDALLLYTEQNYWKMLAVTVLIYTLCTALSLPVATILSLATGMLFGRWMGTAIILFAATLGASLLFLCARYLLAEAARQRIRSKAPALIDGFHAHAFHYLLFLRLVPLFPFWLVNLAPALTTISLRTFVSATALGIIPGCFVYANLGQSLGSLTKAQDLISSEMLLAFCLLGIFALIPVGVKKYRARQQKSA